MGIDVVDSNQSEKMAILSDLCKKASFLPHPLLENKLWKELPSTAKEIYTILASNYDYKDGLSKVTHSTIQSASGIGSRATIVKSLKVLREFLIIHVVEIGTKNKIVSHNYLMPYQEEFYAQMLGIKPRDFSHYNPVRYDKKPTKKKKSVSDDINPLFFKACYKFICLDIDTPNKILEKYSEDLEALRTIIFMADCAYIIKKHSFMPNEDVSSVLVDFIKNGNISKNAFGIETTEKVREILIKNKQKAK